MEQEIKKNRTIEKYLNRVKFREIRIGSLIAQYYALSFINKGQSQSIVTNLLLLIKYILTLWNNKKVKHHSAEFIFTKLTNRFHFNALMNPLIFHYQNNSIIIYNEDSFNKEDFNILNFNTKTILFEQTISNSPKDSIKILKSTCSVFYLLLKNRKRLQLKYSEIFYFGIAVLVQLRRTSFWNNYFAATDHKTSCVVTEFDRSSEASPLIMTAQKYNIETITLIHGVLEDYSFTPFLAKYIFCWGESQKSQLISKGIDAKRIFLTGNPMFESMITKENSDNHANKNLCICLSISPEFDNNLLIGPFAEALDLVENTNGILKLHPSLEKNDFKWIYDISSKIKILDAKDIKNKELFKKCDLMIINDSGIANEALSAGVPVVVMLAKGNMKLNAYQTELTQIAGCQLITNKLDLVNLIIKIKDNPSQFNTDSIKQGKRYLNMLYSSTGTDSINAMISHIDNISKGI